MPHMGPCPACGVPNIRSVPNSVNDMACCILSVTPLTDSCDKRLFSFSIFALRYFAARARVGSKT